MYVGNYASDDVVKKAIDLGVVGILAGGADRTAFIQAKKSKVFLGLFTGFGKAPTPHLVFNVLKEVVLKSCFVILFCSLVLSRSYAGNHILPRYYLQYNLLSQYHKSHFLRLQLKVFRRV